MAIIKAVKSGASLARIMSYIDKKDALTRGKDCSDERRSAFKEMQATKAIWGKRYGQQYKHYIQSFSPEESNTLTVKRINELGMEWAQENFPGHEVFISTHTDRNHYHNHFIVNSVNYENGRKWHQDRSFLKELKDSSDRLCKKNGLAVINSRKEHAHGEVRAYDMKKYQCIAQGKSYLTDAYIAMERALEDAISKKNFIQAMERQGYTVNWLPSHKHVTLIVPNGHRIRTSNLAKTFNEPRFAKEGIEYECSRNQAIQGQYLIQREGRNADRAEPQSARIGRIGHEARATSGKPASQESTRHIQRELHSVAETIVRRTRPVTDKTSHAGQKHREAPKQQQCPSR